MKTRPMTYLIQQTFQPDQIENLAGELRRNMKTQTIAYRKTFINPFTRLHDEIEYFIDTRPTLTGGDPIIRATRANRIVPNGHDNPMDSDNRICLGFGLYGLDLATILRLCDTWTKGIVARECERESVPVCGKVTLSMTFGDMQTSATINFRCAPHPGGIPGDSEPDVC